MKKITILSLFAFSTLAFLSSCSPSPDKIKNKKEVVESMILSLQKQHPDSPGINASELSQLMAEESPKTYLIDVRTSKEREESIIPTALTLEEFNDLNVEPHPNHIIVVYDTFGYRSLETIEELKKREYPNTLYLEGGVIGWAHAQLEFQTPEGDLTKRVHVSSEAWSLLPENYEAISE